MRTSGSKVCFSLRIWVRNMLTRGYSGPKVNIEHRMLGREETVIDGKEGSEGSDSGSVAAREAPDKNVTEVV